MAIISLQKIDWVFCLLKILLGNKKDSGKKEIGMCTSYMLKSVKNKMELHKGLEIIVPNKVTQLSKHEKESTNMPALKKVLIGTHLLVSI